MGEDGTEVEERAGSPGVHLDLIMQGPSLRPGTTLRAEVKGKRTIRLGGLLLKKCHLLLGAALLRALSPQCPHAACGSLAPQVLLAALQHHLLAGPEFSGPDRGAWPGGGSSKRTYVPGLPDHQAPPQHSESHAPVSDRGLENLPRARLGSTSSRLTNDP